MALPRVRKLAATSDARLDRHTVCSVTRCSLDAPGHRVGVREQKFLGQVSVWEQREVQPDSDPQRISVVSSPGRDGMGRAFGTELLQAQAWSSQARPPSEPIVIGSAAFVRLVQV